MGNTTNQASAIKWLHVPIIATITRLLCRELTLQNEYLRQENKILKSKIEKPVKAVLMDLGGTSVRSEEFWIWIIQKGIASLIDNQKFELEEADLPYVSGHSVSEQLKDCINKYCPDKSIEGAL